MCLKSFRSDTRSLTKASETRDVIIFIIFSNVSNMFNYFVLLIFKQKYWRKSKVLLVETLIKKNLVMSRYSFHDNRDHDSFFPLHIQSIGDTV